MERQRGIEGLGRMSSSVTTVGNGEAVVGDEDMPCLVLLTSMATRRLMADLGAPGVVAGLPPMTVNSMGGIAAAQSARDGTLADMIVLDSAAIEQLCNEGVARQPVPLFVSEAVIGVPAGVPAPDVSTVDALCASLRAAAAVGYSTGPSGRSFVQLLREWGLTEVLSDRLVQSPPGTPVAEFIADGRVTMGVQQRSEFEGAEDVIVLPLPDQVGIRTVFTGAVLTGSVHEQVAAEALARMGDPALGGVLKRHGMSPVQA